MQRMEQCTFKIEPRVELVFVAENSDLDHLKEIANATSKPRRRSSGRQTVAFYPSGLFHNRRLLVDERLSRHDEHALAMACG